MQVDQFDTIQRISVFRARIGQEQLTTGLAVIRRMKMINGRHWTPCLRRPQRFSHRLSMEGRWAKFCQAPSIDDGKPFWRAVNPVGDDVFKQLMAFLNMNR
jgi:hypothetical protein